MNTGIFGEGFPYSNFHDLNMDWIIKIAKDFLDQYTNIQDTITQGMEDLDTKAEELQALLDEWYTEHSQDISDQLADALEDLNQWYTTHENYLDQTLTENISLFQIAATEKAEETLATIPDDYTDMYNTILDIEDDIKNNDTVGVKEIDLTTATKVTDAFLRCDGNIDTSASATNLAYYKFPCVYGEEYYVTGQTRNTLALYGFLDANEDVIERYPTTDGTSTIVTYLDEHVTVPSGAKYMIVNDGSGWVTSNPSVSKKCYNNNEKLVQVISAQNINTDPPSHTTLSEKYVSYQNMLLSDEHIDVWKYSVNVGEKYRIIGQTKYGASLYAYVILKGETEVIVGAFPSTAGSSTVVNQDETITIPVGVKYLLVNDGTRWALNTPQVIKIVRGGFIDKKYTYSPLYGKKVNVIGDSMVAGYGVQTSERWTTLLANMTGATVRNYGINGSYLSNHSDADDAPPVVTRYTNMDNDADYVIVYAGTNDANNNIAIGTDDSTDTETIKGALNVLCDGLITKYPKAKICFITPYLRLNSNAFRNTINAIADICKNYSIPVFNNWVNGGVYRFNTAQANAIMLDNTHLNAEGMKYCVNKYKSFIEQL